jgi:ribosomal protein S6
MKIQSLSEKQLHKEVDSVKVIIEDNGGKIHYYDLKIESIKECSVNIQGERDTPYTKSIK